MVCARAVKEGTMVNWGGLLCFRSGKEGERRTMFSFSAVQRILMVILNRVLLTKIQLRYDENESSENMEK